MTRPHPRRPGPRERLGPAVVELRERWGRLLVARSRGEPLDGFDTIESLEAAYRSQRAVVGRLVREERSSDRYVAYAAQTLDWMDEWASPGATGDAGLGPEDPETAALRRATMGAYGEAASAIDVGGESVDRLTVLARLAQTPDAAQRRDLFLAMEPMWRAVDGDGGDASPYRRLVASSAARWRRDGSPVDAAAAALGLDPAALEGTLRRILGAWRRAFGGDAIEPWDFRYLTGAADRTLAEHLPADRLRRIVDGHLASLGADPAALRIEYDITPRPGRAIIPVAFTITPDVARRTPRGWVAARPWIFATYLEGGLGNLQELLHEAGHAIHYAAIRAAPELFEPDGADTGLVEGIAEVLGWDVHEPAFHRRHLGVDTPARDLLLARLDTVVLDVCWTLFELELHRRPDRRPNEVWTEITAEGLGIAPHPEWSWWAARGQLIDGPGYIANYAFAAIVAADVRARLRELRGDWVDGDPGWYPFLADRLLRFGGERSGGDVLAEFLGRTVSADALLAEIDRTGRVG